MTNIEKATEYVKFRIDNDYEIDIELKFLSGQFGWFLSFTEFTEVFYQFENMIAFLAQCYDDEVEAGNIKLPYEPAKVEVFHGSEN